MINSGSLKEANVTVKFSDGRNRNEMCCLYSRRLGGGLSCLLSLTLPIDCLTQTSILEWGLFNSFFTLKYCYNSIPYQPAPAFPKQRLKATLAPEKEAVLRWYEVFPMIYPPTYIYICTVLK